MQEKQKSGTSRTEGKNKYAKKKKAGQIRMMTRRQTNKDQGESTHTHTHNPVRSLVIMKSLLKSNI